LDQSHPQADLVIEEIRTVPAWPTRLIGAFLLLLQGGGLFGEGVFYTSVLFEPPVMSNLLHPQRLSTFLLFAGAFALPLLLISLAAVSFLIGYRRGWHLAMIAQGIVLYASLTLYFSRNQAILYPIMIFSLIMIFYLNSPAVRQVFRITAESAHTETVKT
jgi:hypothetical protein